MTCPHHPTDCDVEADTDPAPWYDAEQQAEFFDDEAAETELTAAYDASARTSFGSDPVAAALVDATLERIRRIK